MDIKEEDISLKDIKNLTKIGKGSFGEVFSGTILNTNKKIALKRVNKQAIYKYGDYLINAFFKELECMRKCNCENSVRLIKNYETSHNYNIIMEFCDGDLSDILSKRTEGFKAEEVKEIMSQLNNAFRKLSENHIIHRDLKLGNILIKYTDESKTKFIPKLCDYGFSKELNNNITATHLGTPATMAPEIMKNQRYNEKADLWSVGVILYQLHFKALPYPGLDEDSIFKKIKNGTPYKQPENPELRDLINKLLVVDPEKRLSWEEYFNHPFFASDDQTSKTSSGPNNVTKNLRYKFIKEFDVGFKSDLYKCFIAFDIKKNKQVFIKSYNKDFTKAHEIYFKTEYELSKAFKGNEQVLQLINIYYEEANKTTNLVYNYVDIEILPNYLTHHDLTEKEIRAINKDLFEKIFIFNECNFKSFIFISVYSFGITKEGKPILFDFGLSKFFLSRDELISYYMPNRAEIGNSLNPTKTNIMNYGITLLRMFYGNNLKIKIDNISFDLPKNKTLSKHFSSFLSQCLFRNINKRSSWQSLSNHPFVKDIATDSTIIQKKDEESILIDNNKLSIIIESIDNKFKLINEFYGNIEYTTKTEYIKEIEIFLLLILFEELMILKIFDRKEDEPFTPQQEVSFISIKKDKEIFSNRVNINFSNPVLSSMKIIQISNNELITDFVVKLKQYIVQLKKITFKIHEITKSDLTKGNYQSFLGKFIDVLESSGFHNYFFSLVREAHNCFEAKKYEEAYKKLPIASYICECILFVKASLFEKIEEKIYFDKNELVKQFNEIFEDEKEKETNEVQISVLKLSKEKKRYILTSFLGVLFRYFKNSMDINQYTLNQNKSALDGLLSFYPSLMKLLVDTKNKMKK